MTAERIIVIGVPPGRGLTALGAPERAAVAGADVVAGARRYLLPEALSAGVDTIEIGGDLDSALDAIAAAHACGRAVVVLATGDPGYFGIGRVLAERFGPGALDVRPALSSVATAFGRLGLPWDDAVVVSAHGRPLPAAVAAIRGAAKVAVLTSPDHPPERIGTELVRRGEVFDRVVVASDLGLPGESIVEVAGLEWLMAGTFPALSVLVLLRGSGVGSAAAVVSSPAVVPGGDGETMAPDGAPGQAFRPVFGLDEDAYEHRGGMITKAEVRAVVLARLALPSTGVLWDVGAGSGSIGIEAAALAPGLRVFAIERRADDTERIRTNAERRRVRVEVVEGSAPEALALLPAPDRVVVGGGGLELLEAVLARLVVGGRAVATYTSLERALAGAHLLGQVVQVSVSRGARIGEDSLRLVALDPVFVCWGPS